MTTVQMNLMMTTMLLRAWTMSTELPMVLTVSTMHWRVSTEMTTVPMDLNDDHNAPESLDDDYGASNGLDGDHDALEGLHVDDNSPDGLKRHHNAPESLDNDLGASDGLDDDDTVPSDLTTTLQWQGNLGHVTPTKPWQPCRYRRTLDMSRPQSLAVLQVQGDLGHVLGEEEHIGHVLSEGEHLGMDPPVHLSPGGAAVCCPTGKSVKIQSIRTYIGDTLINSLLNCEPMLLLAGWACERATGGEEG